jgi:arylsulfatase A-like enzyme
MSVGRPSEVAPVPAARSGGLGPPALTLPAGSGLEYAFRLPEEAEFRFTPRVPGVTEGPISFRIELTFDDEATREVSVVDLGPGTEPAEVRVHLPGQAGQPALLGLHVAAPSGTRGTVGIWEAPRVLGLAKPPSPAPASSASLEALRRQLRDASVLLIVLDAASARHLGCYGYGRRTTPEIDRLASEGFLFERAYTPAPFTGLAMASLWTSQHPEQHHHGVSPRGRLPEGRVMLAELLRDEGIPSTAFIGNNLVVAAGLTRGFAQVGPLYLRLKHPEEAEEDSPFERIVASISESVSSPFLTYVHYAEPHFPYNPPPPFDTVFGSRNPAPEVARSSWFKDVGKGLVRPKAHEIAYLERLYDGNLAAVDHEIGLLRRRLEEGGHWRDLVVIVTSDHGESFWEHGQLTHGTQVYEEMVRIPLIIRLPGEGNEPARIDDPVDLLDLGATLADIFGVSDAAGAHLEGRSLLPLLVGDAVATRPLIARTLGERPTYSLLNGRLKLIHDPNWGASELFDLGEDRAERRDLSGSRPVLTELFRQSLYRWLRDLDRGEPALEEKPTLTPENEEALRALGYVD